MPNKQSFKRNRPVIDTTAPNFSEKAFISAPDQINLDEHATETTPTSTQEKAKNTSKKQVAAVIDFSYVQKLEKLAKIEDRSQRKVAGRLLEEALDAALAKYSK